MNPIVLIATHQRTDITCRNIDLLLKQEMLSDIMLVTSDLDEYNFYDKKYHLQICQINAPNNPLGAKWQAGVTAMKNYNHLPDPLIIIGSDDLFGKDFLKNICLKMEAENLDFIGINQWYIHDESTDKLYLMEYAKKDFPLGGGRGYSLNLLQKLEYVLFDVTRNRLLDDYGWNQAQKHGKHLLLQKCTQHGLNIISIKGNWTTMNSAESILKAKSCIIVKEFTNAKERLEELL